jgi:hypothetical protein
MSCDKSAVKIWFFKPNTSSIKVEKMVMTLPNLYAKIKCKWVECISFSFKEYEDIKFYIWMNEEGNVPNQPFYETEHNEVATKFLNKIEINGFYQKSSIRGRFVLACQIQDFFDEERDGMDCDIPADMTPKKFLELATQQIEARKREWREYMEQRNNPKEKPLNEEKPLKKEKERKEKECVCCHSTGVGYKLCGGCKKVSYCGASCQKQDWTEHKKVCGKKCAVDDVD